ncbi:hypothetical protein [Candidatus Clostridium radicumherbarum]|uniref:DUF4405 domain-containing protein n=1 Tax=Candidatus Clostridium radicumherbarum TaxID=3381662 RepID=A0ABW8TWP6_9CLOT
MKNKLIRIITASLVSMFVAIMFIKFGLKMHIQGLEKVWGIPMTLAMTHILFADIRIWKEKEENSVSLG